jgi:hypothetical protein
MVDSLNNIYLIDIDSITNIIRDSCAVTVNYSPIISIFKNNIFKKIKKIFIATIV